MRKIFLALLFWLIAFSTQSSLHADQNDKRLPTLFDKLRHADSPAEAAMTQASIWSIWMDAKDKKLNNLMRKGVAAMNAGRHEEALTSFNQLIKRKPEFAEAWNKRALLFFMMGDYKRSMDDIQHTLELEPRHFGAISGIGLIEVAKGNEKAAIDAFERVLAITPQNTNARDNIEYLKKHLAESQI